MQRAIRAGLAYFALVFALGFGLGVLRVTLVIPRIGETAAVLLEAPVLLTLAWCVCRRLVAALAVPETLGARLLMGALAFAVLMLAELALAMLLFGRTPAEHLDSYRRLPALIGLAAQLLFAAFPLLQRRR